MFQAGQNERSKERYRKCQKGLSVRSRGQFRKRRSHLFARASEFTRARSYPKAEQEEGLRPLPSYRVQYRLRARLMNQPHDAVRWLRTAADNGSLLSGVPNDAL